MAAISLTTGTTYTQNFDTLASAGTSSTLPDGWVFSEAGTNANATYTAGTGSERKEILTALVLIVIALLGRKRLVH